METKTEIRKRLLEQRNALSMKEVNEKSAVVFERLCKLRQYDKSKIILAYMDYRNEVMTGEFIKRCRRDGKRVVLPKVESGNGERVLSLYEINEAGRDILPGFKGIPEPDSAILNRMYPAEIDLAVIPGVAFDYGRHRIGYGAGYYDRFLSWLRQDCVKAGVAYSMQLVDKIPAGRYDIPMDIVVTEDMLI